MFARDSKRGARRGAAQETPQNPTRDPSADRRGKIVDPFAADRLHEDPGALAERVVFKLWSDGSVKGRAIEQARREAGDKIRLDQALTRLRLADPEPVAAALAAEIGAPLAEDRDYPNAAVLAEELPRRFVSEALTLPLADDGKTLVLAMADPLDDYTLRAIAMKTRRRLAVKVACAKRLEAEIERLYKSAPAPRALTDQSAKPPARPAPERRPAPTAPTRSESPRSEPPRRAKPRPPETPAASEPASTLMQAARPNFIRPRRVTLKDATDREEELARRADSPLLRGVVAPEDAPQPRREERDREPGFAAVARSARRGAGRPARPPESERPIAARPAEREMDARPARPPAPAPERPRAPARAAPSAPPPRPAAPQDPGAYAPGSVAAQVAAQVAERRAERERRAAETAARRGAGGSVRFDEIRRRAAEARTKDSAARRRVLEEVREAIASAPAASAAPARRPAKTPRKPATASATFGAPKPGASKPGAAQPDAPKPGAPKTPERPAIPTLAALREKIRSARNSGAPSAEPEIGGGLAALTKTPSARAALAEAIGAHSGLILIVGPSGSGKTGTVKTLATTRAGALTKPERFDADRVRFPRGEEFRVFWGEIRDAENAEAAARAAMAGALVIASLDAAGAAAAAPRLIALGLPPYALASSLRAVLAQTMTEAECTRCAGTGRAAIGGGACPECQGDGRVESASITEALLSTDATRALILSQAPEAAFSHAIAAAEAPQPAAFGGVR